MHACMHTYIHTHVRICVLLPVCSWKLPHVQDCHLEEEELLVPWLKLWTLEPMLRIRESMGVGDKRQGFTSH